jgi:hypothetical protein
MATYLTSQRSFSTIDFSDVLLFVADTACDQATLMR